VPGFRASCVWSGRPGCGWGRSRDREGVVADVPIRLQGQPVGTLDVYSSQPRAWSGHELAAVAEFATVAAELVTTRVELATLELEVTQLRQALASRVWIEQAKGVLAATQGIDPEAAFQQLRARARSSSRKLAVVAQEVVQDAQRRRLAARAVEDVRVREAEVRARAAELVLRDGRADLDQCRAALDQAQVTADGRDRMADARNHAADARDSVADERDRAADDRQRAAEERDRVADERDRTAGHPD
jgi:hypothetical protein